MIKYLVVILLLFSISSVAADSTLVRIRVDVDSVQLSINNKTYITDFYGNSLINNTWFNVSLEPGDYNISLIRNDSILVDTLINILDQKIIALEYNFQQSTISKNISSALDSVTERVDVTINSDPDSASVIINGDSIYQTTPLLVQFPADSIKIEVYKENYENLVTNMMLELNRKIQVHFILKTLKPDEITPESLGMEFLSLKPIRDPIIIKNTMNVYSNLTTIFAIFPLGQGVIAKLSGINAKVADNMIYIGLGLTSGSFLLGKLVSSIKMKKLKKENIQNERYNEVALENNRLLNQLLKEKTVELEEKWEKENLSRGKVHIIGQDNTTDEN